MGDWNPEQYLQFKTERTQPAIDLVSRIQIGEPESIIDIGCGPGNSTQILAHRWPNSEITGFDNSTAMIEKARHDYPNNKWITGDAAVYDFKTKYDLIFSNAALQWIGQHETLLPRFFQMLNQGGTVAVQIPKYKNMPVNRAVQAVSNRNQWKNHMRGCDDLFNFHDLDYYYKIISPLTVKVELWETSYFHILDSQQGIIDFIKTTGMKPHLDRLDDEMKSEFEREVLLECKKYYTLQSDGRVLFPFERLFFIAYK